jgi:hypothetical protein
MTSPLATALVPPLVLVDGHDVMICATVAVAERFLEPWAVEDGSAEGFDATGRRLAFRVETTLPTGPWSKVFSSPREAVRIEAAEQEPSGGAELAAALRDYVRATLPSERVEGVPVPELIALARRNAEVR